MCLQLATKNRQLLFSFPNQSKRTEDALWEPGFPSWHLRKFRETTRGIPMNPRQKQSPTCLRVFHILSFFVFLLSYRLIEDKTKTFYFKFRNGFLHHPSDFLFWSSLVFSASRSHLRLPEHARFIDGGNGMPTLAGGNAVFSADTEDIASLPSI